MINKLSLGLIFLFIMNSINAIEVCFIAKEGTTILIQEGDCDIRYSPCSTFKMPLAIIGYQENILIDESFPEWPYLEKEYQASRSVCQKPQNPTTWIQNSCLWYSQIITQKVGMKKLCSYLDLFNYGNKDLQEKQEKIMDLLEHGLIIL